MANAPEASADEIITFKSGDLSSPPDLRFIHYNDVYHVEPGSRDPVGGIARFKTLCDYYRGDGKFKGQPDLLTLFSGDAFNPSLESSVTKGRHMVPVLNLFKTAVTCLGNHDLDFGIEQFEYLAKQCEFPWLCANVFDPALGEDVPLANCKRTAMLTSSNGIKIGVIGLVEREWLDTLNALPPNVKYLSASATAKELAPQLRKQGAEIVIALTHMRQPNDEKLASKLPPGCVDIVLGGHDHTYSHCIVNETHVLKSGTDFKQLSYIEARRKASDKSRWDFHIVRRDVVASISQDPDTIAMVDKMTSGLKGKLEKPIGYTAAPLDARFTTVRLKESNLGNFVCDLMRFHYGTDCCIMAAGTIRGDQIYPPGVLKVKDIMNCFPFEDPCVVIKVKGKAILEALENAVGKHPALEGRFPQVSNIELKFDPSKLEGSRIVDVSIGGQPVDLTREYTMTTRQYMVQGKDGFESLKIEEEGGEAKSIVGDEEGMLISMILRQYFMSLKVLGRWRNWGDHLSKHWGKVHNDLHETHPVREPLVPRVDVAKADSSAVDASNAHEVPSLVGKAQRRPTHDSPRPAKRQRSIVLPGEEHLHASDSEDDHTDLPAVGTHLTQRERELIIMRKVTRKWWRLAGMQGHPNMCEEVGEEFGAHWTRGICPRLEGRIKVVGSDV